MKQLTFIVLTLVIVITAVILDILFNYKCCKVYNYDTKTTLQLTLRYSQS